MVFLAACLGPALLPTLSLAQSAQPPTPSPTSVVVPTPGGDVSIIADRLEEVGPDRLLVATGNVEITHGAARLMADRIELNRDTGDAVAQGRVVFYDGENQLTGRRVDYNVKTCTGVIYKAEARAAPHEGFIDTARIDSSERGEPER